MKLIIIFPILVVTTALAGPKDELNNVTTALAGPEKELINGTREFTATLYKELIRNKPNQNVVFSPIMIQNLMSLISSASRNESDATGQIRQAFSLPHGDANRQAAFKSVLEKLNKQDNDFKVFNATKMYLKNGYVVADWYQLIARNVYGTEIETVDFRNSVGTLQRINTWVEMKTNNKIRNFVDNYDISANTENLMINAIDLSGSWDRQFSKQNNIIKNFMSPNGVKPVIMMTRTAFYEHYEDNGAQYLKMEMVRDGGGAEMVFVLPKQQQGLSQLEHNIQHLLRPIPFIAARVDVTLPKFSFSSDMKLKPVLQNIGVTRPFQWGVPLEGLRYSRHPYTRVTDVFQKAVIDVNEWGLTDSVESTIEICVDYYDSLVTQIFRADHPFLFYITIDDAIVYAGRVMEL